MDGVKRGAYISSISWKDLEEIRIVVPPLSQQEEIVARIEKEEQQYFDALAFTKKTLGLGKQLFSPRDINILREVQYMRNRTVHEGRTPSKDEAEWAVNAVRNIIKHHDKP